MKREQKSPPPLLIKLCSDKAAFEVLTQRRIRFDMDGVKRLFEGKGNYEILVHTPYIMVLKDPKGVEVTLSENGRMLIKRISKENEARAVALDILRIALKG